MSQYFHEPYERSGENVNVELDLSNYAKKADLKVVASVNTSKTEAKSGLTKLKAQLEKQDVDKLETILADLSKLSNVVDNDVVRKSIHDKKKLQMSTLLMLKVPCINGLVSNTQYDLDKQNPEKKVDIC